MNPSASSAARGAIAAIVILLAAVLGLVAGNVLNAQTRDLEPGAGRVFANVWGNHTDAESTAAGAPAYADPYRQIIQDASAESPAQDRVYQNVWGNHADDDEPTDASLTRPTLR